MTRSAFPPTSSRIYNSCLAFSGGGSHQGIGGSSNSLGTGKTGQRETDAHLCRSSERTRVHEEGNGKHSVSERYFKQNLVIRKDNDHLMKSCDTLSAELRSLKMTEQAQRATIRDLTATVDELTKNLHMKDVELTKLQNRIEVIRLINVLRILFRCLLN